MFREAGTIWTRLIRARVRAKEEEKTAKVKPPWIAGPATGLDTRPIFAHHRRAQETTKPGCSATHVRATGTRRQRARAQEGEDIVLKAKAKIKEEAKVVENGAKGEARVNTEKAAFLNYRSGEDRIGSGSNPLRD